MSRRYRSHRPEVILDQTGIQLAWSRALAGDRPWERGPILDVGCGHGAWLRRLLDWGLDPAGAEGIDLIQERVEEARRLAPTGMRFVAGSGLELPYPSDSFALVCAHTVFSSVVDRDLRLRLAAEMRRVLAPGGCILLYDFRYPSPRNRDVVAIRRGEVARLFPESRRRSWSLTLLPPLNRRLAPLCPWLALALERCAPPLRSHVLHRIEPREER